MKVHITGVAGVLGSYLAEIFTKMGFSVQGNDIVRIDEAWRLKGVRDNIRYIWKATQDLTQEDLTGVDLIIDAGLMVADRPMGTSSPEFTTLGNLLPPLRLLELVRRMPNNPFVLYPSSFNSLYGHPPGTTFTEDTLPSPSTVYGWTKASAELLYLAYHKSFGVKAIITRVGSSYGPRGRSDELPMRLIIYGLLGRTFKLRSPYASRLWTYIEDAGSFYMKLVEKIVDEPDAVVGKVLILAGNKGDRVVTNVELAEIIRGFIPTLEYKLGEYEPGELINGKPVHFTINSERTRKLLNWQPQYTLEEGLSRTIEWFRNNLHYYV